MRGCFHVNTGSFSRKRISIRIPFVSWLYLIVFKNTCLILRIFDVYSCSKIPDCIQLYPSNAYSVVSQKSCIFYVSYTYTDIQQYDAIEARIRTERIRYKDKIQGYDTYRTDRIRYKDTIQGYDTKYDTRILLTIGKIKSPKNQIKTYALDLMNMVMITHFCN